MNELIECANKIKEYCTNNKTCTDCIFCEENGFGCIFGVQTDYEDLYQYEGTPVDWNLKNIAITEGD